MFKVQKRMCDTCIYRAGSPLDLEKLEGDVRDRFGGFCGHITPMMCAVRDSGRAISGHFP